MNALIIIGALAIGVIVAGVSYGMGVFIAATFSRDMPSAVAERFRKRCAGLLTFNVIWAGILLAALTVAAVIAAIINTL